MAAPIGTTGEVVRCIVAEADCVLVRVGDAGDPPGVRMAYGHRGRDTVVARCGHGLKHRPLAPTIERVREYVVAGRRSRWDRKGNPIERLPGPDECRTLP